MMERKEIIKNVLIIFCVIILFFICALVLREINPELYGATRELQRIAFFLIVTSMVLRLIYQIYNKPLTQEMKEEEIRETDQKEKKQLLFKPTFGGYGIFLFFILFSIFGILIQFISHEVDFDLTIAGIVVMIIFFWAWYGMPVLIFTEDSVQIQSHLFYLLGIDRKTVFRYADITSVSPDAKMNGMYGVGPKHQIVITSNGTTQKYSLVCYNSDIIAKIYLRFREKLGDKVKANLE